MKRIVLAVAVLLTLGFGGAAVYLGMYEKPAAEAIQAAEAMERDAQSYWLAGSTGLGYLIYPGGKVDERAYAPLAQLLAARGDAVAIARMPFRLAILDPDRAASIQAAHPEVTTWVLVGHSLGGTAAGMYLAGHPGEVGGIVFLASYPYRDISGLSVPCLSLLGERDAILGRQAYAGAEAYFPADTVEVEIPGGNHSGFGDYGLQRGDAEPAITPAEQQEQAAREILARFSGQ